MSLISMFLISVSLMLLLTSWCLSVVTRSLLVDMSILCNWLLLLLWVRTTGNTDIILGVILVSFLIYLYYWRVSAFPLGFYFSEGLILSWLALMGVILLLSSWDMLLVYLSLELMSVCFYTLCMLSRTGYAGIESAS